MSATVQSGAAQRLRATLGRLARLLRPTEAGLSAGLTPTRVAVLLNIVRNGPVRLAVVAEAEGLNPTLLSRSIGHLVGDGLVVRSADPADRRSAWVEATPAGRRLAERIRRQRTRAVEEALEQLDAADVRAVQSALPALERLADVLADRQS
jgi:DNA-binding MarR family transcriptional regulator